MRYLEKLVANGKDVERKESKEKILELAERTWREIEPIINEKYPEFNKNFRLKLNSKLRTCGGRAYIDHRDSNQNYIELNDRLLANNLEEVRMVVIHEVAHLIQYTLYKGHSKGHDFMFMAIMRTLGCEGTKVHNMDTSEFKNQFKTMHKYACECKTHELTSVKHSRIVKGAKRKCVKCRAYLTNYLGPVKYKRNLIGGGFSPVEG